MYRKIEKAYIHHKYYLQTSKNINAQALRCAARNLNYCRTRRQDSLQQAWCDSLDNQQVAVFALPFTGTRVSVSSLSSAGENYLTSNFLTSQRQSVSELSIFQWIDRLVGPQTVCGRSHGDVTSWFMQCRFEALSFGRRHVDFLQPLHWTCIWTRRWS